MIDIELLKYLDAEQANRLRSLEQLFSSPGWDILQKSAKAQYETAKLGVLSASTWEENRIHTGRMQVLGELLKFEDSIANELQNFALQKQAEKEQADLDAELEYE